MLAFENLISSVKSAHFRKKNFEIFLSKIISKLISNVKGVSNLGNGKNGSENVWKTV